MVHQNLNFDAHISLSVNIEVNDESVTNIAFSNMLNNNSYSLCLTHGYLSLAQIHSLSLQGEMVF